LKGEKPIALMIFLAAIVIIACLALTRVSNKIGLPTLGLFIGLGMLLGSDGILKIPFDDYNLAEQVCSVSLIFIMFYGGFGTNWKKAKSTAPVAVLLSTLGVVVTAALTGVFCRLVLHMEWTQSFLIGAVISSTDAASVFSILRSRKLNLKNNTASLLEVESGSNDPFAYMMTITLLSIMDGRAEGVMATIFMLVKQVAFGAIVGILMAYIGHFLLTKVRLGGTGNDSMLIFAVALLSYGGAAVIGGNGYLSTYITGIMLGNMPIRRKKELVHFFDGVTGLMQIFIFFLLGLLSFPSRLPRVALSGLLIALFMTFVARPAAVFAIMSPFKCSIKQQLLVSWSGLRGAASIVFAIMATVESAFAPYQLFNTIFFIVLFSIIIQGSLIPYVAKWLDMIDNDADVMKTFSDYTEEIPVQFLKLTIGEKHPWANHELRQIRMTPQTRIALIVREGIQYTPNGMFKLRPGDTAVLSGPAFEGEKWGMLTEVTIGKEHEWYNRPLRAIQMEKNCAVAMIQRGTRTIIPDGNTVLLDGDVVVINEG